MSKSSYFFWLAGHSILTPILMPELTVLAILALITALVMISHDPGPTPYRNWLVVLPFVLPIIILILGVVLKYEGPPHSAPKWHADVVWLVQWSHIPIGIALGMWLRRWVFVICMTVFHFWLSTCASIMACMSVTNIWL